MIRKVSPLVKFEILGVFVNTMTSDHKFPGQNCDNSPFLIQTILS